MAKTLGRDDAKSNKNKKKKKSSTKKVLLAPGVVPMKEKGAKPNPFESIWTRRKFDILGKKRRGEEIRIGSARSKSIEKRKETLLTEYHQNTKSSMFLDKRIGEKDDTLEEMDKSILRFQRERQIQMKRNSRYNLADADEDFLTEAAGSLSKLDDFEDDLLLEEDEDAHESGGGQDVRNGRDAKHDEISIPIDDNKQKTKKEVMEEIISKSKFYKAQKAKDKEEDEQLMDQLDKDFTSLAQSDFMRSLIQPSKMSALKALLNNNVGKEPGKASTSIVHEETVQDRPDAYDRLVKEMVMDMRARPSDRTKTPEEIAQEERARLEELEEERKKRMLATEDSDDEDDKENETTNLPSTNGKWISGEDLGDSFNLGEVDHKGWVDEIFEREEASDDGSDDEASSEQSDQCDSESDQNANPKDWEQSDDELLDTDNEQDTNAEAVDGKSTKPLNMDHQKLDLQIKHKSCNIEADDSRQQPSPLVDGSLPFIIEAPTSLKQLSALLDNRSDAEVVEAITRIRKTNAISLAAENRKKMQVFYGVLLQYFAVLANRKPVSLRSLNLLVKPLLEMSSETPFFAAICARERLVHIRNQFYDDLKKPESCKWPSLKILLLLRLWSIIFPCSDYRHVVITPVVLLMCEYLMRCPIATGRDIAVGSFLCSLLLSVCKQSGKLCPEAINFLHNLLARASKRNIESRKTAELQGDFVMGFSMQPPWLHITNTLLNICPVDLISLMSLPPESSYFSSDDFRAGILSCVTDTLRGFVQIYEGISSFPEIFNPVNDLVNEVSRQETIPEILQKKMVELADVISKKSDELLMLRRPVQMRKQKPVPIKQFNPKFEENYVKGRDYDPDRERAERKKFQRQLKREARGAARELRKDNQFLAAVKDEERSSLEEERADKYRKARAFLEEQEHAFKSGQLGKGRKRRK